MLNRSDWIQTFTGIKFFPLDPKLDDIHIVDIAHSLSKQCRFNGHTNRFYSVAEHSVLMVRRFLSRSTPEAKLTALLHDASEAYLSDIPRPLKHLPEFAFYREAENQLQEMIWMRFGVPNYGQPNFMVKDLDQRMLYAEALDLMSPLHPDFYIGKDPERINLAYWSPDDANHEFINEFNRISVEIRKQQQAVAA